MQIQPATAEVTHENNESAVTALLMTRSKPGDVEWLSR